MHPLLRALLIVLLAFFAGDSVVAAKRSMATDLSSLDSCIKVKPSIDARYEAHLSAMKQQLRFTGETSKQRLRLLGDLVEAYSSFQFDSAYVYSHHNLSLLSLCGL